MKSEKKKNKDEIKKKGGRPRKDRTGLPQVDIVSAIGYTKKAYETIGTNLKSFSGMAGAMEVDETFARRAFGEMKVYGLIEQESGGWKITDLGRRASEGDANAVLDIIQRAEILGDLYNSLKDKAADRDYIIDFIKKKRYKYNIVVESVADRFIQTMNYLNSLQVSKTENYPATWQPVSVAKEYFSIIQLRYALKPPTKNEISKLAETVSKALEKSDDVVLKTFAESIRENKGDEKVLLAIVENAIKIISAKYPSIIITEENLVADEEDSE